MLVLVLALGLALALALVLGLVAVFVVFVFVLALVLVLVSVLPSAELREGAANVGVETSRALARCVCSLLRACEAAVTTSSRCWFTSLGRS